MRHALRGLKHISWVHSICKYFKISISKKKLIAVLNALSVLFLEYSQAKNDMYMYIKCTYSWEFSALDQQNKKIKISMFRKICLFKKWNVLPYTFNL